MKKGLNFLLIFLSCMFILIRGKYNNKIDVTEYSILNKKIPEEFNDFKIVQLSDFHSNGYKDTTDIIINKIENINPDIVVMTGDMVSWKIGNIEELEKLISSLSINYPIYYINGNHEQLLEIINLNEYNEFLNKIKNLGVAYIKNNFVEIFRDGESINLYEIDIPLVDSTGLYVKEDELDDDYINNKLSNIKSNKFNILLAHNPLFIDEYSSWGADLVLSGHMHGGVIRIPIIDEGVLSPEKKFFPKYDAGEFKVGDTTMIINRGIGTSSINLRVFNKPEISVITLKSN